MHGRFDQDEAARACIKAGSTSARRIEAAAMRIALTITVIFAVTFAYLYWMHRESGLARPATPPKPVPHTIPAPPSA